jgi:hypothetical protein
MEFDKEFKQALHYLPAKEKDKLVMRLLRKDQVLAKRMYFELVSSKSKEELRDEMGKTVCDRVGIMTDNYYSPGYLMMDLRSLSGEITSHVKTTKDKYGEASLNLLMLNEALYRNNKNIENAVPQRTYKYCSYIIARTFKILMLITELHEDYQIEFEQNIIKLGEYIGGSDLLMRTAISNGLDVNWLLHYTIPHDIKDIYKNLRNQGFL